MGKIAIHGFGRIGRSTVKAALDLSLFTPAAISDIKDIRTLAALFEVDTNYGRWKEPVSESEKGFKFGEFQIPYFNAADSIPDWGSIGVDLVIDCTGRATVRNGAQAHLDRGAKRVLVSAPSKTVEDCDAVLMPGINLDKFNPETHKIVSMASCTSNALAPVVKVVREQFGIQKGFFSTVHSYTNTQSLTDQPMRDVRDMRDCWAAAENIIPSSSGAAKALLYVWPDLQVTGKAYRVPTRTGSIVELTCIIESPTTAEEVREVFRRAAETPPLKGIMTVFEDEWASSRIVGESHSSIIDLPLVQVMGGNMVSIAAWYDNEMGYSYRLADTAAFLSN